VAEFRKKHRRNDTKGWEGGSGEQTTAKKGYRFLEAMTKRRPSVFSREK